MQIEPISNEPVVTAIVKRITNSIIQGEIKPGHRIPTELDLAQRLGVGRNSVREAVKMLVAMGVLHVRRGQGTFVATQVSPDIFNPLLFSLIFNHKCLADIYDLRIRFEALAIEAVIDKGTPEDIRELSAMLDNLVQAYEVGDRSVEHFAVADMEFHLNLLKATHNPLIERVGSTIMELFPLFIERCNQREGGIMRYIEKHYQILDVILRKDRSMILSTVESTLNDCREEIEKAMTENDL